MWTWILSASGMLVAVTSLALASESRIGGWITLGNRQFRYVISSDGWNVAFQSLVTGEDYLRKDAESRCASVVQDGKKHDVSSVQLEGDRLILGFDKAGVKCRVRFESKPWAVVLSVEDFQGRAEAVTFLDLPLALCGAPSERFGACALALNLRTRVDSLPVLQTHLRASAEKTFGIAGAKVAIVGGRVSDMLRFLQDTISNASELPVCRVAGPWSREVAFNRGSYLFNFGSLTETNVDDWVGMVRRVGFDQIDNHGGGAFFRFGDFELDREKWPDGWDGFARIVARLRDAG
ncbi:MAG: hypothetical protein N3G20_08315, partial [Verrucomicrobiae bacterium]|nr:hypothetical protein [Verrucomicrobiae bacterium]